MKKKRIFHHFWGTIIKGNQKNFLEGESPHFKEFPHSDCLWSIRIFFSSSLRSSRNQTSLTEEIKSINRSSHRRSSVKKGVLKNFTKFTGKRLCQSLFFSKVVKKETLAQVFSCEVCEIFKNIFLQNTSGQLLLNQTAGHSDSIRNMLEEHLFLKLVVLSGTSILWCTFFHRSVWAR